MRRKKDKRMPFTFSIGKGLFLRYPSAAPREKFYPICAILDHSPVKSTSSVPPVPPYSTHRGLPFAAGVCSLAEAAHPGLGVEDNVARLKRYHYALKRLHNILVGRLAAEPVYELKMLFSLHAYYCAEHATVLRKRVGEMREPPLGLDAVPDRNLEVLFDEMRAAPTAELLLTGIYEVAVPALAEAVRRHAQATNAIADHETTRFCKFALIELGEMQAGGAAAVAALLPAGSPGRAEADAWVKFLHGWLAASGGLDGSAPRRSAPAERRYSGTPFRYDFQPRRDERFPDPYNRGVNAEAFLHDPAMPDDAKMLMLFYKRLREIDVPEWMASMICETPEKPWAYHRDLTRQLWDEARHAIMGEVCFATLGLDWPSLVMINSTTSIVTNGQLTPLERHALLFVIEQGLMAKTGKRYEWEVGIASQNAQAAVFQDYDWADEVLHARIGRDWYVSQFKDTAAATEFGERVKAKVSDAYRTFKRDGLTQNRNWWPDLYRAYCESRGRAPDPAALAYATPYDEARAVPQELGAE